MRFSKPKLYFISLSSPLVPGPEREFLRHCTTRFAGTSPYLGFLYRWGIKQLNHTLRVLTQRAHWKTLHRVLYKSDERLWGKLLHLRVVLERPSYTLLMITCWSFRVDISLWVGFTAMVMMIMFAVDKCGFVAWCVYLDWFIIWSDCEGITMEENLGRGSGGLLMFVLRKWVFRQEKLNCTLMCNVWVLFAELLELNT